MAVTPAGAEVSQAVATNWKKIWKKNLKPLADRRYYTKAQSDTKYQPKGSYETAGSGYTKAESDAKYAGAGSSYSKAESDAKYQPQRALQLGQWSLGAAPVGGQPLGAITFPEPVAAAPMVVILGVGAPATANCPGSAAAPDARAGYLCIYSQQVKNQTDMYSFHTKTYGTTIAANAAANADNYAYGSWALR